MSQKVALVLHGGAGTMHPDKFRGSVEKVYLDALHLAASIGRSMLLEGSSALDAVEATVKSLEDCPLFNAGRGSVFNADGQHEMDAAIMCGRTLNAGAIAGVQNIKNPITLSRAVLEKSQHVMLSGWGAFEFAHRNKVEMEEDKYFHDDRRYEQWKNTQGTDSYRLDHSSSDQKFGTVGAVALDLQGHLASATSTGGMTNKRFNRIGDSSIIGAGTYANDLSCAVSCTGHGEPFMKAVAAHQVHALVHLAGLDLKTALKRVVHEELPVLKGDGGIIALGNDGNIALEFNCPVMFRAWTKDTEEIHTAITA